MEHMLNNHLLIKLDPAKEKTEGGIHLPDEAKDKPLSGIIVNAPEKIFPTNDPTWYINGKEKIGQRAHFPEYCATLRVIDGNHTIIKFTDLWALSSLPLAESTEKENNETRTTVNQSN